MEQSVKRTAILVLMFVFVLGGAAFASKMKIQETTIVFADGTKIKLTASENEKPEQILEKNRIFLLDDEKINDIKEEGRRKLIISKKDSDLSKKVIISESNSQTLNNYGQYDNFVEKIEVLNVEIPFNTITRELVKNSQDINSAVVQIGQNGIKEIKYRSLYKNDKLVEQKEISSKVIKEPIDKIVEITPKAVSRALPVEGRQQAQAATSGKTYGKYSEEEFQLLCAITAQESASSYEGALAVITTAINRTKSPKWSRLGSDPLTQYKARGQFSAYGSGAYKKRLPGGKYPYGSHVERAVKDALNGKLSHSYLGFRSASYARTHGMTGPEIGGNVYLN